MSTNWKNLTKEELVHLLEGDDEVEALILNHLQLNMYTQKQHKMFCDLCTSISKKVDLSEVL